MGRRIFYLLDLTEREKSDICTKLSFLFENLTKHLNTLFSGFVGVVYLEGAGRKDLRQKPSAVADKTERGLDASQQFGGCGLFCCELLQLRLTV